MDTIGTVVGSTTRRSRRSGDRARFFVPVVEWTAPDGLTRTAVPLGVLGTARPPELDVPMAIAYDPQDPAWVAVPGRYDRGGFSLLLGAGLIVLGLFFVLAGSGVLLLVTLVTVGAG